MSATDANLKSAEGAAAVAAANQAQLIALAASVSSSSTSNVVSAGSGSVAARGPAYDKPAPEGRFQMPLRHSVVEGVKVDAPNEKDAGKPRELTVRGHVVTIPPEYSSTGDAIVTVEVGPDGVEKPAEFLACSEHARTFEATMGDAAEEFGVAAKMSLGGLSEEEFTRCNATFNVVRELTDQFGEWSVKAKSASDRCDNGAPPRVFQLLVCTGALMLTAGVNRYLAGVRSAADFDERIALLMAALSSWRRHRARAAASEAAALGASARTEAGATGGGGPSEMSLRTLAEHITPATSVTVGAVNDSLRQVVGGTSIREGTTPKGLQGLLTALKIKALGASGIGKRALLAAQALFPLIDPALLDKFLRMVYPMVNAEAAGMLCKITGHAVVSVSMLLEVQAPPDGLAALDWLQMKFFNLPQQLHANLRRVENSAFESCTDVLMTHVVVVHIRESFQAFDASACEDTTFTPLARSSPEAQRGLSSFEGEFNRMAVDMR
eukprot:CAMPEP_0171910222 /NCGR_PEP_ID=MMETSP0993-20121228/9216_1 /TAXON_ID=483369 /ORGANISM="non described non described, Strain CCMP2098" /LENGTH=494 /DNA_ID=CAMNT_0012543319 /DNA_START=61 /DNA_END=1541 /DNA_ORIENTATION=+